MSSTSWPRVTLRQLLLIALLPVMTTVVFVLYSGALYSECSVNSPLCSRSAPRPRKAIDSAHSPTIISYNLSELAQPQLAGSPAPPLLPSPFHNRFEGAVFSIVLPNGFPATECTAGPDAQRCDADGRWYDCSCEYCALTRSCPTAPGLQGCACPMREAVLRGFTTGRSAASVTSCKYAYQEPIAVEHHGLLFLSVCVDHLNLTQPIATYVLDFKPSPEAVRNSRALPVGVYQTKCSECEMDGTTLRCSCPGGRVLLGATQCELVELAPNGRLECSRWSRKGLAPFKPIGSFQQSCTSCRSDVGDRQWKRKNIWIYASLECKCKGTAGESVTSKLVGANRCADIGNNKGVLVCANHHYARQTERADWQCYTYSKGGTTGKHEGRCANFGFRSMQQCQQRCEAARDCRWANYDERQTGCGKQGLCVLSPEVKKVPVGASRCQ